jgi:DNA/RNA-binding domain of Phe-tRNA-synthetase-like protein
VSGAARRAAVSGEISRELAGLSLWTLERPVDPGRSPAGVRQRLRALSNRVGGAQAVTLRSQPITHSYRVLFRHLGIDPDEDRTPVEAAILDRLVQGGFRSRGIVADALTIALVETGVPLEALDAASVDGALWLRTAGPGETLGRGEGATPVPEGRVVVADERGPLCGLFAPVPDAHAATRRTECLVVYAVQAPGVPDIHVEEALWTCSEVLDSR